MVSTTTALPADALALLRARVDGTVLVEGAHGYAESFAPFNTSVVQRPAVVVVAESVADVVHAVRCAADLGLRVAVQSTGHGIGRPADGALLVVTSRLRRVRVDPVNRTAFVGAGNRWGDVLPLAQEHGLAPVLGSSPLVGCVGFTLGGGVGWLARRYGFGSDNAVAFDVVTPDGSLVRASAHDNPELFWALRGVGGGPFGVVVGMEIALHPLSRLYAGNLYYPAELAGEVARRWRDWVAGAPEELSSSVVLMQYPPAPEVPEALRGRSFAVVRGAWCGDAAQGTELLDDWRRWRTPLVDAWADMPFGEVGSISHDPVDPMPAYVTTEQLDSLPDEALDLFVDGWQEHLDGERLVVLAELRQLGGAVRRGGADAANDRARSAEYCLEYVTVAADEARAHAVERHYTQTRDRLAPFVTGATYLNFTEGAEKAARTASAAGGAAWQRLRTLKSTLDPANRFCHGFVVPPFDVPLAGVDVPRPRQG
ncbi:FAD-binding oxidoreductase [Kineosporia sp. R_H_3]|uniref:FAD-binding oxidoreductase n=1 Tax=Kineosporia sp. R_H_3 TaxID=1961848 RepID=UPI000B4AC7A3|nr:FAD-binding oxidoreductase [Kineosporia sp. R_H_3]